MSHPAAPFTSDDLLALAARCQKVADEMAAGVAAEYPTSAAWGLVTTLRSAAYDLHAAGVYAARMEGLPEP